MERKIVVAVDESEESMFALSWCITNLIADTPNVKLVLLYVKPPPPLHFLNAAWYMFSSKTISAMEEYGKDLANSVMERAEAICKNLKTANSIKMERVVGCGDAKDVICSAVQKLEADTLVLGTHGYGFFKRALVGSVSDYCVKYAKCAVVIVKQP
ncbi:Universal stress protein A protein [Spatholobus suberectus]|nr:Universal stress protein A protein [Spatholobus suberectus]TKY61725.1 Universal stress protein A protein [Spatholobus suberectus]